MLSILKSLFGGSPRAGPPGNEPRRESVDYNGFRIRPEPYPAPGGHQTAGVIEKTFGEEVKAYRFVRAETHPSADDAATFAIAKGKQIIDERGDRLFGD